MFVIPGRRHDRTGRTAKNAILDTNVVIADGVRPLPGLFAISAVALAELHFGVLVAKTSEVRAERLRRPSVPQKHFDALPVDEALAVSFGRLAAIVDTGRQPSVEPWTC